MKSHSQSIWRTVTVPFSVCVILTFLMYAGDRPSLIILIKWYSGQSHLNKTSDAVAMQVTNFSFKLALTWSFFPSVSAKQKLIIADFYHVFYRVVLRLSVNLKLIKDTQLRSLLTWLFTFPSPVFSNPFIRPSVPQCSLSLRIRADGRGTCCLTPGGQAIEAVREREMEGERRSQSVLLRSWHSGAVCSDLR